MIEQPVLWLSDRLSVSLLGQGGGKRADWRVNRLASWRKGGRRRAADDEKRQRRRRRGGRNARRRFSRSPTLADEAPSAAGRSSCPPV